MIIIIFLQISQRFKQVYGELFLGLKSLSPAADIWLMSHRLRLTRPNRAQNMLIRRVFTEILLSTKHLAPLIPAMQLTSW